MTIEQLRLAREANPFRPFTVHLADGRSHRVPHRDWLSMSPGGRTIIVYVSEEGGSIPDSLMITELSFDIMPANAVVQSEAS